MKCLSILTTFLLFASLGHAEGSGASKIQLDPYRSQAIFNAIDRFKLDGYVSSGYQIVINSRPDGIEIVFFAQIKDGDELAVGSPPGKREVHYLMDAKGQQVLKRSFGR